MTDKPMTLMRLMVWAGEKRVNEMLPAPLSCYASDHSTGCQAFIEARQEGMPRIEVWRDSEWYSSTYYFNEHGKVRGIQAGCDWARPAVEKLHTDLSSAHAEASAKAEASRAARELRERETLASAHTAYAEMLR